MDLEMYVRRLGRFHVEQRLAMQVHHAADAFGPGWANIHVENMPLLHYGIRAVLRACGLYGRGRANTGRFVVTENALALSGLAPALEGLRVLHLSDFHADFAGLAMEAMLAALRPLRWDLCVWTGDYRGHTHGPWEPAAEAMRRIREAIPGPVYAILGNHDPLEIAPAIEAMGVRLLLNEREAFERDGARLWIVGVDDPHTYEADSIEKAMDGIPAEEPALLLSHAPDLYRKAAYGGVEAMLCGHTHGGQLCLPGGWPLTANTRAPRRMAAGAWRFHRLQGYTSRGCGVSSVECRLNCRPEIVVHTLARRAPGVADGAFAGTENANLGHDLGGRAERDAGGARGSGRRGQRPGAGDRPGAGPRGVR